MRKKALIFGSVTATAAFFILFLLAFFILPSAFLSGRFFLFILSAALLFGAAGVGYVTNYAEVGRRRIDRLLSSLAAGNLKVGLDARSAATAADFPGFQKLLRSFRNIITYLQDTSENVAIASGNISEKTRRLMGDAEEQAKSTEVARHSVHQLDEEIEKVVISVDTLSGFIEQTSVSILEMRSSIEEVVEATHTLASITDEIATSTEQMSATIEQVAGHADSLSSFAIQNSSAMMQMDATISQIEENIRETESMSKQVAESAQAGINVENATVHGLEKIHEAMSTTIKAIDTLGVRSNQIGNILKVIRDIADQTNLLALNAAIIAAQAGEHGKSFGVVAEEIRDLSERTAASTSEVGEIIIAIQKDVEAVGRVAKDGMNATEEGVRLGKTSEESLQKIGQAISIAGNNMSHIARAATEQAKGSRQVTAAMEEMTRRVESISLATREQAQTSQVISKKTINMQALTRNVDNAMRDQASGSTSIAQGMEQVRHSVDSIQKALLRMSQAGQRMVEAMDVIGGASQQNFGGARDLSATSNVLRQESLLLVEELSNFSVPQPQPGGEMKAAYTRYDYRLDPAYANNIRDGELVYNIFEGLVRFGHGTRIMPGMAREWNLSPDGKVYTFILNPEAKFHNGRRVNAKDVVYSFERSMSPRLDNEGKWFLGWAEGVEDYVQNRTDHISGLRTVDDQTVEIRLKEPLAFFLYMLTSPEAAILPQEVIDDSTLRMLRPIGSGPYKVADATPNFVALERFPDYHIKGLPHLDRFVFDYTASDGDGLIHALKSGGCHLVPAMGADSMEKLLSDPLWANQVETTVLLNTTLIGIRNDMEPFTSKEVRQAMNYALDLEALVSKYPHSKPVPAKGILPPGILAYNSSRRGYHYDPDKARWLLSRSGHGSGFDLTVPVDSSRVNQQRDFATIVEMLNRVGVRVVIETLSHAEFDARRKKIGRPLLYSTGWYADYPDPDSFLYVLFHSKAGDILSLKYANPKLDELVERGRRCLDIDERIKIYREAEDIVVDDAPCLFLYHNRGVVPHSHDVMGMKLFLTPPTVRPEYLWLGH